MRWARHARGPIAAFVLALVARDGGAACVPSQVLQAITHAKTARIVALGTCPEARSPRQVDPPGQFFGCPRLELIELSGAAAAKLVDVFAHKGAITCDEVAGVPDWSDGAAGEIGLEFESELGLVRMLLRLPNGALEVGFANGARYDAGGSDQAAGRWRRFAAAFAAERHRTTGEFYRDLLAGQESPLPASVPPLAMRIRLPDGYPPVSAPDDTACGGGHDWYGANGEFVNPEQPPEVVFRVEPDAVDCEGRVDVEGDAEVWALVCRDGRVHDVKSKRGNMWIDPAAISAVRQWTFRPARSHGRAVACWIVVPVVVPLR